MAKRPQAIGDVLAELMARRGFNRVEAAEVLETAWVKAAGTLAAKYTRVAGIRRGKLEVVVANSTLMQELVFQKAALRKTLSEELPDEQIQDLRFRVGKID